MQKGNVFCVDSVQEAQKNKLSPWFNLSYGNTPLRTVSHTGKSDTRSDSYQSCTMTGLQCAIYISNKHYRTLKVYEY